MHYQKHPGKAKDEVILLDISEPAASVDDVPKLGFEEHARH